MKTEPWKCSRCTTVVFIPDDGTITGGVCSQQRRGCKGEIAKMDADEAERARGILTGRGMAERPWLTLIFTPAR